jgi:protein O-GlcNAc transferase
MKVKTLRRVLSFAVWGRNPKYLTGALRNAQLAQFLYPGWEARFYVQTETADVLRTALTSVGASVYEVDRPANWSGAFWRYEIIGSEDVDIAIFRDCDSRLSLREATAVGEWLLSGTALHVMRDHPAHAPTSMGPIMAGMWGVRCERARWICSEMADTELGDYWCADQHYLAQQVWPRLQCDCLEHDEFYGGRPFPVPRIGDEFVGQVYDQYDMPCESYSAVLRHALNKKYFVANSR